MVQKGDQVTGWFRKSYNGNLILNEVYALWLAWLNGEKRWDG